MNGPEATFDRAIDLLNDADPESVPEDHVNAPTMVLKALLDADRPLTKREIVDAIGGRRSERTTRRVLNELEEAGLIERHRQPPGGPKPDRFEVVDAPD